MDSDSSSSQELFDIDPEEFFGCFDYRDTESASPQIKAVLVNDFPRFEALIKSGKNPNVTDNRGCTPLHIAIEKDRKEMFDLLLTMDNIRVDVQDFEGRTPLILACMSKRYYVSELVKKGADIHLADFNKQTPLHHSVRDVHICFEMIQSGAKVNVWDMFGQTPLFYACHYDVESVHLLLCHGADVHLCGRDGDWSSLDIVLLQKNESLAETLVLFGFDHLKVKVKLLTIRLALESKFACVWDIINSISGLASVTTVGLKDFRRMRAFDPKQLLAFLNKVPTVGCQLLKYFNPLKFKYYDNETDYVSFLLGLNANCLAVLIDQTVYFPHLWLDGHNFALSENTLTVVYCFLLSHNLSLTTYDLDSVFHQFGFCSLFELLLHMKIERQRLSLGGIALKNCVLSRIIYDIDVDAEKICHDANHVNAEAAYDFFVGPCLLQRLKISPRVPSLLELSRNVSRKFLIKRYRIKDNVGFFTMLKSLCINQVYKDIICYKKPIYFLRN